MQTPTRFSIGNDNLIAIDGEGGAQVMQSLEGIAPDVGKYIVEFAFGDIYSRPKLDFRQREIITLSSLAAIGGAEAQLRVHINAALNVDITEETIIEVFIQAIPYIGFPRVLNAIFTAKDVFEQKATEQ